MATVTTTTAPTKPGHKSSEFWLSLIVGVLPMAVQFVQGLPPSQAQVIAAAVIGAAYSISRGLAKGGSQTTTSTDS